MNESFSLTGGARIGRSNVTYPFASLHVDKNALRLNASIVGKFVFRPEDLISVEPYRSLPIIGQGLKIHHRVPTYNDTIIFWTLKKPQWVIEEINRTGFFNNKERNKTEPEADIALLQQQGGFPVKKPVAIIAAVLWNVLFLADILPFILKQNKTGMPFGYGIKTALALLLLTCVATLVSDGFRRIILKEGRGIEDIRKVLFLLMIISGGMLLSILAIGWLPQNGS